ncbi:hypothetical protein KQX54_015731 [Cotesia glomerata]|uniref:Uncharacterized protein n=1 Tax=Cotesia glomerata TaxID=32391 RepID=A0AAV7HXL0_COTGL|nr:hypothetical protein KQX54_015731 [Cotesia glomerata]
MKCGTQRRADGRDFFPSGTLKVMTSSVNEAASAWNPQPNQTSTQINRPKSAKMQEKCQCRCNEVIAKTIEYQQQQIETFQAQREHFATTMQNLLVQVSAIMTQLTPIVTASQNQGIIQNFAQAAQNLSEVVIDATQQLQPDMLLPPATNEGESEQDYQILYLETTPTQPFSQHYNDRT